MKELLTSEQDSRIKYTMLLKYTETLLKVMERTNLGEDSSPAVFRDLVE